MRKNLSISSFKQMPWAFFICLILFMILESSMEYYAIYIEYLSDRVINFRKKIFDQRLSDGVDAIILGDSRGLGIDAQELSRIISKNTRRPFSCYNFTFPHTYNRIYYSYLKYYLDNHRSPRWVFLCVSPYNFTADRSMLHNFNPGTMHRFVLMFPLWQGLRILPFKLWPKYFFMELENLSIFITYRKVIKDILIHRELPYSYIEPIWKISLERNGGIHYADLSRVISDEEFKESVYYSDTNFIMDPDSEEWIIKLFELAEKHNINVVMFNMPLSRIIIEKRHQAGFYDEFEKKILEWTEKYSHVYFVGPIDLIYENKYFMDQHHLDGEGFQRFHTDLANFLIQDLSLL